MSSCVELSAAEQKMLAAIPSEGVGNKTLRTNLKMKTDMYWEVRNSLVSKGVIQTGRGKGGSVKLVKEECAKGQGAVKGVARKTKSEELKLYKPIAKVLMEQWAKEQGYDDYAVEVTGNQGSKRTGGRWSRPDIVVVGCKTYRFLPGRFIEVITFEVKTEINLDISAVYEAIAHRRAATKSVLIISSSNNVDQETQDEIQIVQEEAEKNGIGFIVIENPSDFDTWDLRNEGEYCEPSPAKLNEFITIQTSADLQKKLLFWLK